MEAAVTETIANREEDLAEKASEFLLGVLERMGISADIDIKDDTDKTVLEIQTGDTELVIGRRGVGIVRVSGPDSVRIVADVLGIDAGALDRSVRVGWARDMAGTRIDQVVAFAMRAPSSFTGEDVAELQGHGGAHNLGRLLDAVLARGARIAEPGEFTRRAVGNGKLDLLRAEALLEVIHAGSERAWRLAQSNLAGRLGAKVVELEHRALGVLAEIEGRIDFPEEDIEPEAEAAIAGELDELASSCA